jgi:hypothetical protein
MCCMVLINTISLFRQFNSAYLIHLYPVPGPGAGAGGRKEKAHEY